MRVRESQRELEPQIKQKRKERQTRYQGFPQDMLIELNGKHDKHYNTVHVHVHGIWGNFKNS